ncbi:xanthine dehydrogenase family protein molybdopterin-binding subunit [Rubrivivax gelatinosus]|uniref:Isoquinoline 1-oxidoreductase beta subunit n=1 Tax=Rubrivivax gelatinosus TaxID=28068 RepID=A0A4R2MHG7_RUBGE|nr:xanthine dehydrogenase family protein molybdopterin-binding subunit [Rubrivivax gelatinosus]MBK1685922.1 carbon monoxide dehydrogenase [Rubrivivax gelatinosus]TCP04054.1 isoquinoline 1-oxidoreductase beta subunit [Rubrivivax gelatinosus]
MAIPVSQNELPPVLQRLLAEPLAAEPMPRRRFLKLAGAVGLALGAYPLAAEAKDEAVPAPLAPTQQPAAFVEIAPDGLVTVTVNRLEFGQGVQTALPLILAEELDADWSRVRSRLAGVAAAYADPMRGMQLTGGSASIRTSWLQYRELGARARAMLVEAAARRWQLPAGRLSTREGRVFGPGGREAGYGELAEAAMALPVPARVTLKEPRDFRLIGQPTTRLDARAKSSGRQSFGIDVQLPGLLTAVIARPPVFGGRLRLVDEREARAVRGVRAVLRVPLDLGGEGVAVVADGSFQARRGRDALRLEWDLDGVEKVDSARQLVQYRELATRPGPRKFDADMAALAQAPRQLEAEFVFPYLAHAAMEPLNCTVRLADDGAEIWTGSQMPGVDAAAAAEVLGLAPEKIRLDVQSSGGGFGRRAMGHRDYVVDACRVAQAMRRAGIHAPVKLLWTREDDMRGGFYRPLHLHRARIGFDDRGRVLAWDHVIVAQSITEGTLFGRYAIQNGIDSTCTEGMRDPYPLPMRLTVHHPKVNVPVHWWRSVGSTHTAFVMESLIDEIAQRTGQDPVAYRLALIGAEHPRYRAALELAVQRSGYGRRKLAPGQAWGVAVHECFGTVVAYVVEASLDDGRPVLHRVTAGVHCNLAVNPRGIEAQLQGAAIMGLSTCLPGSAITLEDGRVVQGNFGDFTIARMPDIPAFDVHLVPSAEPPSGMGEPGLPPLAPAFANAIARLAGRRLRSLPFDLG